MTMDQKVIDKVQKLMNLSEDAKKQGSVEEAALAAEKAQAIMMKYNLSMEQVKRTQGEKFLKEFIGLHDLGWDPRMGSWIFNLYSIVGKVNFCRVFGAGSKSNGVLYIVGKPGDMEVAKYMAESIVQRLLLMQPVAWKQYIGPEKKGTFRRGYFTGAVVAISAKLTEAFNEATNTEQTQAIIHVKTDALNKYMDEAFNLKPSRRSRISGADGYHKGKKDGEGLPLSKGVKGNTFNQGMLN